MSASYLIILMCAFPALTLLGMHAVPALLSASALIALLVAAFGTTAAAGGLIGPVLMGVILDVSGSGATALGWGHAVGSLGIVMLAGAIAVRLLSMRRH